ncbi:MAG: isoprenylcysteine carboxylmethyltransferase family protein [Anaerolineaceae bacterium]|nr:isoprenylcysteine carboxylmethyltransferase family protein [Anaerolineaceae bacterium]
MSTQEQILLGMLSVGMLLLPLLYSVTPWLNFANYSLPGWVNWTGAVVLAGAVGVFWRGHTDLGVNWSPSLEIYKKHELVTRGVYKIVRHPMYASLWLWVIAQPLLLHNRLAGCLHLLIAIPFNILRVGPEEEMMLDSFGSAYSDYMKQTGRVIPKIK